MAEEVDSNRAESSVSEPASNESVESVLGPSEKIDTLYSLRVELPRNAFYEIEAILRKYEDMGAIHILQSSRFHLDSISVEV